MTSVAALLGFSKDMRAYLGRWAIGMTSSEEYVRTARQVVYKIQRAVNRSIVEGQEAEYFEDEALDSLCKTAEDNGANPARIRKRHNVMLGMQYPTLERREGDWIDVGDDFTTETLMLEEAVQDQAKVVAKHVESAETHKYFITISRRAGHRRLHLVGCFVKPSNCCEVRLCSTVTAGV